MYVCLYVFYACRYVNMFGLYVCIMYVCVGVNVHSNNKAKGTCLYIMIGPNLSVIMTFTITLHMVHTCKNNFVVFILEVHFEIIC